jgi:hypothetical protein
MAGRAVRGYSVSLPVLAGGERRSVLAGLGRPALSGREAFRCTPCKSRFALPEDPGQVKYPSYLLGCGLLGPEQLRRAPIGSIWRRVLQQGVTETTAHA